MSSPDDRSTSRTLASRWIATLDDRPFRPTPERLAWVAGGDLVEGEARARRLPIAAARHASLFADHVMQDMAAEGGPGAYVRIWLCARRAFIDSMSAVTPAEPSDTGVASWENEGGAALVASPPGVDQPTDRRSWGRTPRPPRTPRDRPGIYVAGRLSAAPY